jgi:hypothetical protein
MIRAALFIARTTIRQAWHTRAIAWLILATSAVSFFVPRMLKADGTPEGIWSMVMLYAPTMLFAILATSSVWLGAYTLASEKMHAKLAILKTKPVSGFSIWLGKWLGVCAVHTLAMLVSGVILLGMILLVPGPLQSASRTFWQPSYPDERGLLARAESILADWPEPSTPDAPPIPTLEQIVNRLRQQQYRVAPAEAISWQMPLPRKTSPKNLWRLQFHWRLDPMRRGLVSGTWSLHMPDHAEPVLSLQTSGVLDGSHVIHFEMPRTETPPRHMILTFHASPENASHIFFDINRPVSLQQASGSLIPNVLRAGTVCLIYCYAIAALALLFSACLSFPVAVFTTYGTLFAIVIASVAGQEQMRLGHSHSHGETHAHFAERLLDLTTHFLDDMHALTRGLREALPFRALSQHIQISLSDHALLFCVLLVLMPLLCAFLAHLKISHEEVA